MAPARAELGGAQAGDEVAPAAAAGVLERGEHLVRRGEATREPLADDGAPDHHAVPVEEVLGGGVAAAGRVGVDGRQQRPPAGGLGRTGAGGHPTGGAGAGWWPAAAVGGGAGAGERAQRGEGVVADPPGPDEVPQGGGQAAVVGGADRLRQLTEEPRASGGERVEHGLVELGVLEGLVLGQGQRRLVGQVERHPSVRPGQRRMTGPQHLAGAGELVEEGGLVVTHPGRQHQGLERGRRHRAAGQLVDDREHAVDPARARRGWW